MIWESHIFYLKFTRKFNFWFQSCVDVIIICVLLVWSVPARGAPCWKNTCFDDRYTGSVWRGSYFLSIVTVFERLSHISTIIFSINTTQLLRIHFKTMWLSICTKAHTIFINSIHTVVVPVTRVQTTLTGWQKKCNRPWVHGYSWHPYCIHYHNCTLCKSESKTWTTIRAKWYS